jgi:hypothetical protein
MTFVEIGYNILKLVFGVVVVSEIIIPLPQWTASVSGVSLKEVSSFPPHFFKVISYIFVSSYFLDNVSFF